MHRLLRRAVFAAGFLFATFVSLTSLPAAGAATLNERALEIRRLNESGRYATADSLATTLVAELRRANDQSLDLANALDMLVESRIRLGNVTDPEIVRLAEEALRVTQLVTPGDSAEISKRLGNLARALDQAGRKV